MTETVSCMIIEPCSSEWKCGFAGDDRPHCFAGVVGRVMLRPKERVAYSPHWKDTYVGDEAISKRAWTSLSSSIPASRGHLVDDDWVGLRKIFSHCYEALLRMKPYEIPTLLVLPPFTSRHHQEKLADLLFESIDGAQEICFTSSSVTSLIATGRESGLVLESGEGVTTSVPIYEGHALMHAATQMNIGGKDVSAQLSLILSRAGKFGTTPEIATNPWALELADDLKKKLCYVSTNLECDRKEVTEKTYELPDGKVISLRGEQFEPLEALFHRSLFATEVIPNPLHNSADPGLQHLLYESYSRCDSDLHQIMRENVILSGGNTMFPGLRDRIYDEFAKLLPPIKKIQVMAPPERRWISFIGASILGSLSTFEKRLVSRSEYEEVGPRIVWYKCF